MRIGIYVGDGAGGDIDAAIVRFARLEEAGFHTAWAGQVFGDDALTVLALAGRATRRIELGTWVVPTAPRHPVALAQQARTVQRACGDRLVPGVGVSHREVIEKRLGLAWDAPARHASEYLAVLTPLLRKGAVHHSGAAYRVSLRLDAMGCAADKANKALFEVR